MDIETLHELFEREKVFELEWIGDCFDCKGKVKIIASLEEEYIRVRGGAVYLPPDKGDRYKGEVFFAKCDSCYEKNNKLTNFQECEVFSRVVGYLRPVNQFNPGKQAEFIDRVDFDLNKGEEGEF